METRRPYVPSAREVELGHAPSDGDVRLPGLPFEEAPPAKSIRRHLRDTLEGFDPRDAVKDRPKRPLVILALLPLFSQWDDTAFGILMPEMRTDFGFDLQFMVGLMSLMGFVGLVVAPFTGYLADRMSRVYLIRIGALIGNASSLLTGMARGAPMLVASRVVAGVGGTVSGPAGFPLLTDWYSPRARARVFSFLMLAGFVGAIVGPLVAGNLGEIVGWRMTMIILGSVALAVSLLTFWLKEPPRGYADRLEQGADSEEAERELPPVSWGQSWRAAASITTVRRLWFATPFTDAAGQGLMILLTFYFADVFGMGVRTRGYVAMLAAAASVIGLLFAGPVGDRILAHRPERFMVIMGGLLLVQAVLVVVMALAPWAWLAVLATLPMALLGSLFAPAFYALLSLTIPAHIRGLGLQTIAPWRAAALVLLAVVGVLGQTLGLRTAILILAPLFVVGAFILGTASRGVAADIRAVEAAARAEKEARRARREERSKILVCRDVQVSYGGVQVLFGVDFDVEEGEIVALLGTNGAGKSTLLRAISGVHEASGGAIFFDGRDTTHVPPQENARDGIVMVPGGRAIFPTLTVSENLRVAAWLHRDEDQAIRERTEEVLGFFGVLRERWEERAGSLSGGEQQMLALGQAFLMRPKLLMIDELTLGLAPQIVEQLLGILRAIHAQGTTIVLVEQSVNTALRIADRAVFMEKGEVRFTGPTADLLARPDILRSVFLGRASSGRAPARRKDTATAPEALDVVLRAEDIHVSFGGVTALQGAGLDVGGQEIVGVIGPNGAGKTTLFDVITGFVRPQQGRVVLGATDVTDLGPDARARLGLGRAFQNARLFGSLTVRENIAVALDGDASAQHPLLAAVWHPKARRIERRILRRADELIDLLGLEMYADVVAAELSVGSRRTLEIACQMAASPEVLLLDEPSSGLAQAETEELGGVLRGVVRETGCALVVIEHDIPLITRVSDRLVAMDLGRVIATGTPDEVTTHPEVVRSYLATSDDQPQVR